MFTLPKNTVSARKQFCFFICKNKEKVRNTFLCCVLRKARVVIVKDMIPPTGIALFMRNDSKGKDQLFPLSGCEGISITWIGL